MCCFRVDFRESVQGIMLGKGICIVLQMGTGTKNMKGTKDE